MIQRRNFGVGLLVTVLFVHIAYSETFVRHRGNKGRNTVNVSMYDLFSNVSTSRALDELDLRIDSIFSVSSFPQWSIQRCDEGECGFGFKFGIFSLVEYMESANINATDGIDITDTIMSTVYLFNNTWSKLNLTAGASSLGARYWIYDTQYRLPSSQKVLLDLTTGISDIRYWDPILNRTLAPDTWEWEVIIQDYPLVAAESRLTVKTFAQYDGSITPILRYSVPPNERDSLVGTQDDFLMPAALSNKTGNEGTEKADIGYVCWETQISEIGGKYPEPDAVVLNTITKERTLRIVESDVYKVSLGVGNLLTDLNQEEVSALQAANWDLDNTYVIYFSFMVSHPSMILWDPYVGLDEQDDDTLIYQQIAGTSRLENPFWVSLAGFVGLFCTYV